ncbi:hypothetical protein TNCV_950381 [Trichonephila clavipes]|nr:hypothetical protein TNCV_950381 [Trichonephila clavipes]
MKGCQRDEINKKSMFSMFKSYEPACHGHDKVSKLHMRLSSKIDPNFRIKRWGVFEENKPLNSNVLYNLKRRGAFRKLVENLDQAKLCIRRNLGGRTGTILRPSSVPYVKWHHCSLYVAVGTVTNGFGIATLKECLQHGTSPFKNFQGRGIP